MWQLGSTVSIYAAIRISQAAIRDALAEVGGPTLASRFASSKKGELAASAERIFAGNFITEAEVKEAALRWLPAPMQFTSAQPTGDAEKSTDSEQLSSGSEEAVVPEDVDVELAA